jgi:hypothetical protein
MIALQGAIAFSQAPLITDAKEFTVRPSAVPTRAAKTEEPFEEKSLHNSPVKEPAKMLAADLAKDDTKPAEKPEDQAKPDPAGAISIDKSYQHEPEITQQTDLTQLCESLSSTNGDSSDFEVGRGLVGDQPSILDYHMETEHLSGFAALQPIRSQHSTSTQATDRFPSQGDTSSGASDEETAAKIRKVTTESAQGREHTHTPESQKHLLTNEALMELDSSEKPPKSLPKTSIVDSNGSPRLIPKKTKNADVPQLDLEDDPVHREEIRVTDTSRSQYSRSSCDLSTEDTYDSVVWTKYQRDMFLEYGIDTDKLKQTRLDPRPMPVSRYPLSAFPKGTTDAIDADRASSSSQRTTRDKMNSTEPENPGPIDRGWGQETPTLPGPDKESQPSTAAHDSMEWITALQVAQNHAQDLLHETNSVSWRSVVSHWIANWAVHLAPLNPARCRKSDYHSSAGDLSQGMRSDSR